jgi:hypothetical protein
MGRLITKNIHKKEIISTWQGTQRKQNKWLINRPIKPKGTEEGDRRPGEGENKRNKN